MKFNIFQLLHQKKSCHVLPKKKNKKLCHVYLYMVFLKKMYTYTYICKSTQGFPKKQVHKAIYLSIVNLFLIAFNYKDLF